MENISTFQKLTLHTLAGGSAGIIMDVFGFPLETLKTRLQGFFFQVIVSGPSAGCYFFGYESTFIGGIGAEVVSTIIRQPFEIMKQQLQMGNQKNPLQTFIFLYQQNSFMGFYRGFFVLLLREIPFSMIQMPIYEYFKNKLYKENYFGYTTSGTIGGVIGGSIAAILTNPIDVIKTNIMTSKEIKYNGFFDCSKQIYEKEGMSVFMKGVQYRLAYASFISLVFFGGYQYSLEKYYNLLYKQFINKKMCLKFMIKNSRLKNKNYKQQMTKATKEYLQGFAVGLNKGFVVTKVEKQQRPSDRKGRSSNRVREIRKLMSSVCEMSPFEKKVLELFKTGINKVEKRAFRLLKRRLGSRTRAKKKQLVMNELIKAMNKKEAKK